MATLCCPSLRPSSLCHCSPTTAIITVDFYTLWYKFRSLFRRLPLMYVGYSYRRKFVQPYELVCFYYKPWCSHGHTFWRMANSSRMSCATSLHPSLEIRCLTWWPFWYNAQRNNWLCVMRVFSFCAGYPFHLLWQEHWREMYLVRLWCYIKSMPSMVVTCVFWWHTVIYSCSGKGKFSCGFQWQLRLELIKPSARQSTNIYQRLRQRIIQRVCLHWLRSTVVIPSMGIRWQPQQ